MTREAREKKTGHVKHQFRKEERELPDLKYYYYQCKICGLVEYPIPQLQKIIDYSKVNQFMFVQDWVLAILYTDPIVPVVGITSFMKQLFLTLIEFAPEHKIPTENPGFKAYYFGPYSERVEDVILGLEDAGLLATSGRKGTAGEYFILTELGKVPARRSFEKLTKKQQAALIEVRRDWQELGTDGLMKYIYKHYPTYAEESLVLDRVLHNRRLGKRKWGLDDQERPHKSH